MTDKLDIPKLLEVAGAKQALGGAYEAGVFHAFDSAFTPAVAIALCERVRELERQLGLKDAAVLALDAIATGRPR